LKKVKEAKIQKALELDAKIIKEKSIFAAFLTAVASAKAFLTIN